QAGDIREPPMEGHGVLSGEAAERSLSHADNEWDADLAAAHVPELRGVVDQLIEAQQEEAREVDLHYRTQSGDGSAHAATHRRGFGDGGISNPLVAVTPDQVARDAEREADGDVLSKQDDSLVDSHRVVERLLNRLCERDFGRWGHRAHGPHTSVSASSG